MARLFFIYFTITSNSLYLYSLYILRFSSVWCHMLPVVVVYQQLEVGCKQIALRHFFFLMRNSCVRQWMTWFCMLIKLLEFGGGPQTSFKECMRCLALKVTTSGIFNVQNVFECAGSELLVIRCCFCAPLFSFFLSLVAWMWHGHVSLHFALLKCPNVQYCTNVWWLRSVCCADMYQLKHCYREKTYLGALAPFSAKIDGPQSLFLI